MRIVALTEDTKQNVMNDLLKRSPNNYSQYESTVNEIIENVKANKNQAVFEYTKKFDKFRMQAVNTCFKCGVFAFLFDNRVNFFARSFNSFFNSGRVNSTV